MWTVLSGQGITISAYYQQVAKAPTRTQLRDQQVTELIRTEREHPGYGRFASTLGSRKMWIRLRDVARCTIERVMRVNGWHGASYGTGQRPPSVISETSVSRTSSIATSLYLRRTVCGSRISPTFLHGLGWCTWRL